MICLGQSLYIFIVHDGENFIKTTIPHRIFETFLCFSIVSVQHK